MKVLVSDNLGEIGVQMFQDAEGIEVDVKTGLTPEELKAIIGNYNGLVIRSATKVTHEIIEAATALKVIGRAGIGLDNVDIPAATKRGIVVMNTPTGNIVTTAEHAIAMMMTMTRNIAQGTADLKKGEWTKKKLQGREVFNKTLGLIGFGKIGSIVADRARGLKMKVLVYDPFVSPEVVTKAGFEFGSLAEVYQQADYISVHVPKLKETTGLLNQAAFEQMKDGVMVINCARGGIINEDDLTQAIQSGKVAGAALDVFTNEPPGKLPLLDLPNVIGTPHLGASTKEAQTNVAVMVAEQLIDFLQNGTIKNAVNVPSVTGKLLEKLSPFLTLGDRMGCLTAQISLEPIQEIIIEYTGDFKNLDLAPVTTAIVKGILTPMIKDAVNSVNALELAKGRGIKITETSSSDTQDYINLLTVRTVSSKMTNAVAGTIFGKNEPRIVKINDFRVEMIPKGYAVMVQNMDQPGAIGSIATVMGHHGINIESMQVGQEGDGARNIILINTDISIPENVVKELCGLPLVHKVTLLEL